MSAKNVLHLVCNAHIDPVWLWEWQEGLAETLSTFRTAADLCEAFEEFVFCHNEALLYRWVEEYEPELFSRIQALVRRKQWHIMGGWFLQPDCNLPCGESLVRQALAGKRYFLDRFGVEPETAVNFDPFGHSRGLVQILKKSGTDSYLFCRPDPHHLELPADDFVWIGYDGSEILAHRARHHYNSQRGKAGTRVSDWMAEVHESECGLLLWGIGNHGGGPSREDLIALRELMSGTVDRQIRHSTPEAYFSGTRTLEKPIPKHEGDLNPWAVGCYTSMALVKQKHRKLENAYYATEKIRTHAALAGLLPYPRDALSRALEDLLFSEFHDILPGSSIPEVESYALQRMDHGLEILSRLHTRALFALLTAQAPAGEDEYPVFIYNPHPFPIEQTWVFEFQPPEPNFDPGTVWVPLMADSDGDSVPCQLEQESSNISNDHRKRVVFRSELEPGRMNRYGCRLIAVDKTKIPVIRKKPGDRLRFHHDTVIAINTGTGLLDEFEFGGEAYIDSAAFSPLVIADTADPWGMKVREFRQVVGRFSLMKEEDAARFAGVSAQKLEPVRIVEEGPVRTIVEAFFEYNDSRLCMHYKIPKRGSEIEIGIRVYWSEIDRMLKIAIPTPFGGGRCCGQVAYGVENFNREGEELAAQKWIALVSPDEKHALTIINDATHGFDYSGGELRLSLLRSPAYAGHPVDGDIPIVPQDRFRPRIDQGERRFRFWMSAGDARERLNCIDREALVKNEPPPIQVHRPRGPGEESKSLLALEDDVIQLTAMKLAEDDDRLILRLFNPTGIAKKTTVSIPILNMRFPVRLNRFEIKTLSVDPDTRQHRETDLLERK